MTPKVARHGKYSLSAARPRQPFIPTSFAPPETSRQKREHRPQPPPRTPRPLRGSTFDLKGYSCAIPHQSNNPHTLSSRPTNSTIAETNLNSPNNAFSLPFSLTSQTATHRLSITYPCSSDFPFFIAPKHRRCVGGLWFCESPRARLSLRSACSLPYGSRTPARGGYPRRAGKSKRQKMPPGQTARRQTKKPLRREAEGAEMKMWRQKIPRQVARVWHVSMMSVSAH